MYAVPTPYQYFTDLDGNSLDEGYLYFGVANQNPETASIPVYWDESATQEASQPIRTVGGVPRRAGSPARLYIKRNYSSTIRNRSGGLVSTAPSNIIISTKEALSLERLGLSDNDDIYDTFDEAYDANVPIILMPSGTYTLGTAISINRNIRVYGAAGPAGGTIAERASGGSTGAAGESTTKIVFAGTDPAVAAITIVGTGTEGLENVHLSDFSLWGNSSCEGGIKIGSGVSLRYCSFKKLHVRGFTNTATDSGYGFYIGNIIDSLFEECFAQANNQGFNFRGVSTTLTFLKCTSRTNLGFGWVLQQCSDSVFYSCIGEGNNAGALQINSLNGGYVSSNDFYSFYCEANCNTISGPVVELRSTGTGITRENNFHKITINEAVAGNVTRLIKFGTVDDNKFYGANLNTWSSGFAECSASTTNCAILGRSGNAVAPTNVVNNGYDSNKTPHVLVGDIKPLTYAFTPTYVSGGAISGITDACYTRDGNKVSIYFTFTISAITGAANVLKFSGLPFVPAWRIYRGSTCAAVDTTTITNTKTLIDTDSTFYLYFDASYGAAGVSVGCQFEYFI